MYLSFSLAVVLLAGPVPPNQCKRERLGWFGHLTPRSVGIKENAIALLHHIVPEVTLATGLPDSGSVLIVRSR